MELFAGGQLLNTDQEHFGLLQDCAEHEASVSLEENGYALIRDFFNREEILGVRKEIALKLEAEGHLRPGFPAEQCVARPDAEIAFRPDISNASTGLRELIYSDKAMRFFSELFGGEACTTISPGSELLLLVKELFLTATSFTWAAGPET